MQNILESSGGLQSGGAPRRVDSARAGLVAAVAATVTVAAVVGAREAGFRPQRQYPLLL